MSANPCVNVRAARAHHDVEEAGGHKEIPVASVLLPNQLGNGKVGLRWKYTAAFAGAPQETKELEETEGQEREVSWVGTVRRMCLGRRRVEAGGADGRRVDLVCSTERFT